MELFAASLFVAATWSILAAGLGSLPAFTLAAALLLATRPSAGRALSVRTVVSWGLAGAWSYPIWAGLTISIGTSLDWAPRAGGANPDAAGLAAVVLVGPLFEELLYRERLLPALESHFGGTFAVALSSVVFAAPHADRWSILAAAVFGPALGLLYLTTRSVWACAAAHAGVNATALWVATR